MAWCVNWAALRTFCTSFLAFQAFCASEQVKGVVIIPRMETILSEEIRQATSQLTWLTDFAD